MADYGGFEYDSDYYGDDLPFWMQVRRSDGEVVPQLIVPYTLDCNDMRFALPQGYSHAEPFFQYLKDSFDALYAEGDETPRCSASACIAACWAGRAASWRCSASWTISRRAIASGSAAGWTSPATGAPSIPSLHPLMSTPTQMAYTLEQLNAATTDEAVAMLDGLYEHSPWIARQALASRPFRSLPQLQDALRRVLDEADAEAGLALIRAHPELAGRAMQDNNLTAESTHEQDKAGLTHCSPEELARLRQLNADYLARFGFPFILAVRGPRGIGLTRGQIIATFERRLDNPPDVEFREALRNIHRIVEIRLADKFGLDLTLGNDIWDWHERLSVHSDPGYAEQGQLTVTYLTDAHRACAQRISHWMRDCGFDEVEIDAVGNVVGRYRAERADAATLMTGSHYDTVRNGGKYDGRLGIFVPMACVRELHRQGRRLPYHLEVIGFAEEEGQRYAATFLGSGALVGDFKPEWLDQRDAQGTTMREAMQHAGLCIDDIPTLRRDPARYLGFVEVHIEQGPVLFEMGLPLGVVTSINGSVRYRGRIVGMASHAGTTPWTAGATRPPPRPSWPCIWNGARRATAIRSAPWACWTCPTARSTWCPANAASAWTCARRQRPARRAGDRRAGRAGRHLPAPGPALRTGRDPARRRRASAGLAGALGTRSRGAGPARASHAQRRRPRRHEAARSHAASHAVRARPEFRHQPQSARIHHRQRHAAGGAGPAPPARCAGA